MLYRNFYIILLLTFLYAEAVSLKDATIVANNFFIEKNNLSNENNYLELDIIEEFIYIFNINSGGFVIVSKDDRTIPILGYSFNSSINLENLPKQLDAIITSYKDGIKYIIDNQINEDETVLLLWEKYLSDDFEIRDFRNVQPLITANWSQGGDWNELCPNNSVVGCVAVAMGQVMYYWGHPTQGSGYSQYYDPEHGIISVNFEDYTYNFDNMENDYATSDSQLLLYHAGVAVHMDYSPWGSGASVCWEGPSAQDALDNHFNYNDTITCEVKMNYSDQDWELLIKDQLDRGWPVIYRGYSEDAGHAWNIDGYQDNYYHCNWGWGGSANGYFYFDNLNGGGYNFIESQAALLNIIPENFINPISLFDYEINDLNVQFNDLSGVINVDEIIYWEWDFGDGNIAYDIFPNYTYNNYGAYEVSLVIMSAFGLYSDPHIEIIEIINYIGDINGDNQIDIVDIIQLVNIILNTNPNQNFEDCDINSDMEINIIDVILLVQIILNGV